MGRPSNQIKLNENFQNIDFDLFADDLSPAHLAVLKALKQLGQENSLFSVSLLTKLAPTLYQPRDGRGKALNRGRVHQVLEDFIQTTAARKIHSPADRLQIYMLDSPIKLCAELIAYRNANKAPKINPQVQRRQALAERQNLEDHTAVTMLYGKTQISVLWRLFNGVLDGCIPASSRDTRKVIKDIRYSMPTRNGIEWLTVTTTTRSEEGARIMSAEDTDVILALNAMYVRHITRLLDEELKQLQNLFVFDIVDLCHELNIASSNQGRVSVINKLRRIRDTRFKIDLREAPQFKTLFGYTGRDVIEVEYLTGFDYATADVIDDLVKNNQEDMLNNAITGDAIYHQDKMEEDLDVQRAYDVINERTVARMPRLYWVSFYPKIFEALITNKKQHGFIAHDALKKERTGWAKRFTSWARAVVGVRNKPGRSGVLEMYLMEFRDCVYPANTSMPMSDFHNVICKMMKKHPGSNEPWNSEGVNKALLFGYYLELDYRLEEIKNFKVAKNWRTRGKGSTKDYPIVRVYRDIHDDWVGDNSKHNMMLQNELVLESPSHG
ncbi:MAG: hypothetical protein JKY66_05315 [Spongiibacteraceae bacterium]|nr:hypothetical protein [Spongiibacteraceae bacterium]